MQAILVPLLLAGVGATQDLQIPALSGPVVDRAGLLTPSDLQTIEAGLRTYHQQTSNQLQVLIIPSLPEGVPMEEYSIRVAEQWKLGTAAQDNGVLLVLAVNDRKWRIEVGGGLEGELTDVAAARIGREILVPAMRSGNYAGGVAGTLQAIAGALGGKIPFEGMRPVQVQRTRRNTGGVLPIVIFALFILFFGRRRGGGLLTGMILGSALGRGGGGGGGGGGGSWGGGGGGFSGGGSGGSW